MPTMYHFLLFQRVGPGQGLRCQKIFLNVTFRHCQLSRESRFLLFYFSYLLQSERKYRKSLSFLNFKQFFFAFFFLLFSVYFKFVTLLLRNVRNFGVFISAKRCGLFNKLNTYFLRSLDSSLFIRNGFLKEMKEGRM